MDTKLVQVCIPSRDLWKAEFGLSLVQMIGYAAYDCAAPQHGFSVLAYPKMQSGSAIAEIRNSLVKDSLKDKNTTHILFVDDDQTFPADTIHRLLSHNQPIIGANIVRKEPFPRTNSKKLGSEDCCFTLPNSKGIEEVTFVGTGLILIAREVFETLGEPYFFYDIQNNTGEDVHFCVRAREKGYKIYIDHDVSKQVKHVGHFYFGHEHTTPWREHDK